MRSCQMRGMRPDGAGCARHGVILRGGVQQCESVVPGRVTGRVTVHVMGQAMMQCQRFPGGIRLGCGLGGYSGRERVGGPVTGWFGDAFWQQISRRVRRRGVRAEPDPLQLPPVKAVLALSFIASRPQKKSSPG